MAVQDRPLHFLFENKGSMYEGKGFEMLAVFNWHCRPNSVANAFTTLMLLFKDSKGKGKGTSEEVMALCSRFDGMVNIMAHCKIFLPPTLIVISSSALYPLAMMTSLNNFAPITKPLRAIS